MYKNESLARNGYQKSFYDQLIKMGGLPKRLDRLIEEVRHIQVIFGPVLFYEYLLYIFLLIVTIYMALASGINSVRSSSLSTHPPWWMCGYILLSIHHYLRLTMFCHAGEHLRRELSKALSLVSQFGYVHNDATLLSLAIARKPDRMLSIAGYAPLDRSTISSIFFLTLLAVMMLANFKLSEE